MTTPIFSSLYQPFPWTYKNGRVIWCTVRCEPPVLAEMVPAPLQVNSRGIANIWLLDFPAIAGCGSYREMLMSVPSTLDGRRGGFCVWTYVNNDAALAAGREVTGIAKKIATITVGTHADQIVGQAARSGVQFATMGMTLDSEGNEQQMRQMESGFDAPGWNLKYIPSHDAAQPPDSHLITESRMAAHISRIINGRGFVDFRPSAADPLYRLRPEPISAIYLELDLVLDNPVAAHDYGDARRGGAPK